MPVRAYVRRDWTIDGHRLVLVEDLPQRKIRVLSGFTWTEEDEGSMFNPHTGLGNADETIQKIVDAAWEAGFRPRGYSDVKNETAAIREHLSDMKTIAFHQLKIDRT